MAKLPTAPLELVGWYQPHDQAATNYTGQVVNQVTGEVTTPPSMTKQEFVEECDINNIIREYTQTGQINHINAKASQGVFEDLPDQYDFQIAQNLIIAANDAFAALPAHQRDRFGNDPGKFLEFMSDDSNTEEAIKLGLATRRPDPPQEPPPGGRTPTGGDGGTPPSGGAQAP